MSEGERPSTAGEEGPAWSATAELWDEHWARLADPARELVVEQAAVGPGTRFLDMGCGTGELCALAAGRGATVSGIDAAEGMIERARTRLPDADLRVGAIENLPWDDDSFDVVTGFNSFQFAAERLAGFREARRVARPRGLVAVCVWGPRENNDLQGLFDAVRALGPADDEDEAPTTRRPRSATQACSKAWPATPGSPCWRPASVDVPYETRGRATAPGRARVRPDHVRDRRNRRPGRLPRDGRAGRGDAHGATTAPIASTTRSAGCSPRPEPPQSTSRRTIATVPTITMTTRSAVGDRRRP